MTLTVQSVSHQVNKPEGQSFFLERLMEYLLLRPFISTYDLSKTPSDALAIPKSFPIKSNGVTESPSSSK